MIHRFADRLSVGASGKSERLRQVGRSDEEHVHALDANYFIHVVDGFGILDLHAHQSFRVEISAYSDIDMP